MKNLTFFFWSMVIALSLGRPPAAVAAAIYENYTFIPFAGAPDVPGWYDGKGSEARFSAPHKVAVDQNGNVYVAEYLNHTIRKISPSGVVTTLAGRAGRSGAADGSGAAALFYNPSAVAVDTAGNVYVADYSNHLIRKITPAGLVTTLAGKAGTIGSANGRGTAARFNFPVGLTLDSVGNLYVADSRNQTIRKITPSVTVSTIAGAAGSIGKTDGKGTAARFNYPFGITTHENGNLYVSDLHNHVIRVITPAGVVTTLAGTATQSGSDDGTGAAARFNQPLDIIARSGNLFVADSANHTVRQVTPEGVVTTVAGAESVFGGEDGTGGDARFYFPTGVGLDNGGNLYIADYGNNTIRRIAPGNIVTTFAGIAGGSGSKDGPALSARFSFPTGIAIDAVGNAYIA
ncbi:MAG TPA: NHL repeat-containing protein, partial [Verrucomicrobiae bacterium]|nr:NHL repeat-containing protein [Verrucomicrobiae bacterium]